MLIKTFYTTFTQSLYWTIMRTRLFSLTIFLATLTTLAGSAQDAGMHYVYFADGKVWGYPKDFVKEIKQDANTHALILTNDSTISWAAGEVISISEVAPEYPQFTSFKLDDKRNDQLYRDVEATVSANEVTVSVNGIGKYLTPSFAMDMAGSVAYVDDKEQISGESRLRFANEVTYTLGHPNYQRLSIEKISEEVWSEPETRTKEIELTTDMLYTNAPSGRNEGLDKMLDGVPNTIFHSTWTNDPVYGSPDVSQQVYVSVELPYAITDFQFYYMGRTDASKYNVYEWKIEASSDGVWWTQVATLDETDGVPFSGSGVSYTSPSIPLGDSYSHLRFTASRVGYKNYLCLSEFRLYEVVSEGGEPELIHPAQYTYQMVPMGREVPVNVEWFTDYATSVPSIHINIDNGEMVSSKEYYLNAHITFEGNGVWDDYDFEDSVKIKGRGNSSWSSYAYAKNPYRLKFEESQKPFGMKKGKNWNLIPQAQRGSLMTNPVAHKIARMVGMQTANDVVPVELYMNGEYRGSYYFTQKVGMANNSVDFDDESRAVLFELDTYYESGQFDSYSYGLPVNIKDPEFGEDETLLDYYDIKDEFNRFETAVYNNANYERFVDMDMLVRYMLVNDLVLNTELGHPKSTFLSREDMGHMSRRYVFGPAWDFDWAYGYEGSSSYCVSGETRDLFSYVNGVGASFYSDILRSSEWVQYRYSQLWEEFMDKHLDELIDFVDDYYAYARSSFVNNSSKWGDGSNYDSNVANMKSWLAQRAHYIKNSLTPYTSYAWEPFSYGDLNTDGGITQEDIECMLDFLFESPSDWADEHQADADVDGEISLSDLPWIALLLKDEQVYQTRSHLIYTTLWNDEEIEADGGHDFDIDDIPTLAIPYRNDAMSTPMRVIASGELGLSVTKQSGEWAVDVSLANSTPYIAFSMDFVIPEAFTLSDGDASISLSSRTAGSSFVVTGRWLGNDIYRVIGYSTDCMAMSDSQGVIFTLALKGTSSLVPEVYSLDIKNVHFVTENAFTEETSSTSISFDVDELPTESAPMMQSPIRPIDIYDTHGRLVRKQATSLNGLSRGVYIVNNRKMVVK